MRHDIWLLISPEWYLRGKFHNNYWAPKASTCMLCHCPNGNNILHLVAIFYQKYQWWLPIKDLDVLWFLKKLHCRSGSENNKFYYLMRIHLGSSPSAIKLPLGPISHRVYELIIEILQNFGCCNNDCGNEIWSQIWTCHDSWAVVICAKLWPDWIISLM